jgi:hypothetical protein
MLSRAALTMSATLLSVGLSGNAAGQDAAETAQILSGVGNSQGSASRSLGANISQSIGAAANAVNARPNPDHVTTRRRARHQPVSIPANGDVLAGTAAPTYRLGNGASIRVSGRLRPAAEAACIKGCTENPVP